MNILFDFCKTERFSISYCLALSKFLGIDFIHYASERFYTDLRRKIEKEYCYIGFMVLSQRQAVFYIPYEKVTDKDHRLWYEFQRFLLQVKHTSIKICLVFTSPAGCLELACSQIFSNTSVVISTPIPSKILRICQTIFIINSSS